MKDFITDDEGDLKIENGHFVFDECTPQNQKSLLLASKGDYRENPDRGVDIENFIEDDDLNGLDFEIRKQFELDGMTIKSLSVLEGGNIKFIAPYESTNKR